MSFSKIPNSSEQNPGAISDDPIIALGNATILEEIKRTFAAAKRRKSHLATLLLNVSIFKNEKEILAPSIPDSLSKKITEELSHTIRNSDILVQATLSEFILVLLDISKSEDASIVADKLLSVFSSPIEIDYQQFGISLNIGISVFPEDGDDVEILLKNAEIAMHLAKEMGQNNFQYSSSELNKKIQTKTMLEKSLKKAELNNEFKLLYQPIIQASSLEVIGVEALLRWVFPNGDTVYPNEIIPLAEESGQIVSINEWVVKTAARQIKRWREEEFFKLKVSVNISDKILNEPFFLSFLEDVLTKTGITAKNLALEISEKTLLKDINNSKRFLNHVNKIGIEVSVDNLGLEHFSLSYLKLFKVGRLKINKALIRNITHDTDNAEIVSTIIVMAHSLNIRVVAEGVENKEQFAALQKMGCDECQGYYFSKPIPPDEFFVFLKNNKKPP